MAFDTLSLINHSFRYYLCCLLRLFLITTVDKIVNIRSKWGCTLRMISATDWFRCRQFRHVDADPWIVGLVPHRPARRAACAGCPERAARRHLAAGAPLTASRCRRRRHLPSLLLGHEARTNRWQETPNADCCDCAFVASTSAVGCRAPRRLEMHQVQRPLTSVQSHLTKGRIAVLSTPRRQANNAQYITTGRHMPSKVPRPLPVERSRPPFQSLAPRSGTLSSILSGTRRSSVQTVSDVYWKHICLFNTKCI